MQHKAPVWQIDIVRHLLGDLDERHDAEVRAYIESGDARTAQLRDDAHLALMRLIDALEPTALSNSARTRLLRRIHTGHQLDAVLEQGVDRDDAIRAPAPTTVAAGRRMHVPASVAAVLAIVAAFGGAILANRRPSPEPVTQQHAAASDQPSSDADQPGAIAGDTSLDQAELFSLADMLESFFDVIPLQRRPMASTLPDNAAQQDAQSRGKLLWDRKHQVCYVFSPVLETADTDEPYQLWFTAEQSEPMAVGLFNVDASGWGWVQVNMPSRELAITRASIRRATSNTASDDDNELLIGHFTR